MPITKEFVEKYVELLHETSPLKVKTAIHLVKVVWNGERLDPEVMQETEETFAHLYPNDTVHLQVYKFVRENMDLFVMSQTDPSSKIENWGRQLAEEHGLKLDEITYDSEMLFFVLNEQPDLAVIAKLREAADATGFIKFPYVISAFELDPDMDVEPGQVGYTMCFWNTENE